jgi:hypothetical protein
VPGMFGIRPPTEQGLVKSERLAPKCLYFADHKSKPFGCMPHGK